MLVIPDSPVRQPTSSRLPKLCDHDRGAMSPSARRSARVLPVDSLSFSRRAAPALTLAPKVSRISRSNVGVAENLKRSGSWDRYLSLSRREAGNTPPCRAALRPWSHARALPRRRRAYRPPPRRACVGLKRVECALPCFGRDLVDVACSLERVDGGNREGVHDCDEIGLEVRTGVLWHV